MKIVNAAHYKSGYKEIQKRHNKRNYKTYRENVDKFLESYYDNGCSRDGCEEKDRACLDFHHRDPALKEVSIPRAINNSWSIDRLKRELDKCDVVCANCHRKLHYYERVSSNGKASASNTENVGSIPTTRA
jgi:hypothetical protein